MNSHKELFMSLELTLEKIKEPMVVLGDTGVGKTTMIKTAIEGSGATNPPSTEDFFNPYQIPFNFGIYDDTDSKIEFILNSKHPEIVVLDTVGQENTFGTRGFVGNTIGLYGQDKSVLLVADSEKSLESLMDDNKWFSVFKKIEIKRASIYLSKGYVNGFIDDEFFDGNYKKIYDAGLKKLMDKLNKAGVKVNFVFVGDAKVTQDDGSIGSEFYITYANGKELNPVEVSPSAIFTLTETYSKLTSDSRQKIDNVLNNFVKGEVHG